MQAPHNDKAIVYIITKLELGGAQKVCLALFKNIQITNTDIILITGKQGILVDGVKDLPHVILLDELTREISGPLQELKAFYALYSVLKKLKKRYSSLILHTHSTKAGLFGRWAAFFARIKPRIHTIHGFGFHEHQSWPKWLSIYLLEFITAAITQHFICVSQADQTTGVRLFPRFAARARIIRAAVGDITCKLDKDHQNFIIGTISCFKPQKNLIDVLKAFKVLHDCYPQTRLEIIGDGEQRSLFESWIKKHDLSHAIILHGWQHHVAPFLSRWHVFALSSLWEGLPCAVVEARLAHLPIVAYNTGGIKEIIYDNLNGFLVSQKNYQHLADKLQQLINDPHLYKRLSEYPDNLETFSQHYMVAEHHDLYRIINNSI